MRNLKTTKLLAVLGAVVAGAMAVISGYGVAFGESGIVPLAGYVVLTIAGLLVLWTTRAAEKEAVAAIAELSEGKQASDQLAREGAAVLEALERTQARIEFDLEGNILRANSNFTATTGYSEDEIVGRHHAIFCEKDYAQSAEYSAFWGRLGRGEYDAGKYQRFDKQGNEVWLQAAYSPVFDENGKPQKVVKFATNITEMEQKAKEAAYKSAAFASVSTALIVLDADGTITFANDGARDLFTEYHDSFCSSFQGFDPSNPVGQTPAFLAATLDEQHRLISSAANMPLTTDIDVGHQKLEFAVSIVTDADGQYAGNVIEIADVTTARVRASMLAAFDTTQALIEFSPDGTIENA
ncbi:MAG: PAS domain S-box protein, partial [Pseudomonadota bacterium]